MRKLPFIVEPEVEREIVRIGTDDYGYYEFVKYGTFRVKEETAIADAVHKQTEFNYKLKKLKYQICRETGKSKEFVDSFVNDYDLDPELFTTYQEPLLELQETRVEEKLQEAMANTMFRYRFHNPDTHEEGLNDWKDEELAEIPTDLRNAVLVFAAQEMEGTDRKKHKKARRAKKEKSNGFSQQSMQDQQTGQTSIGQSEEAASDTTQDLQANGLGI